MGLKKVLKVPIFSFFRLAIVILFSLSAGSVALAAPTVTKPAQDIFQSMTPNQASSYNGLALTPPMGWSSWAGFKDTINENLILKQAQFLISSGLAKKGYQYVNVDCCWMLRQRNANGELVPDPAKFPSGMKSLGDKIHAMGLKFGLYTDAGPGKACGSSFAGSYGHEKEDVKQFVAWGIDYLKIDGCYVNEIPGKNPETVAKNIYNLWSKLLKESGRDIIFSNSAPAYFSFRNMQYQQSILEWAPTMSNVWRVGLDVANYDADPKSQWATMLRNFEYTEPHGKMAGPGHFNDPDYLIIGNGMSLAENRTQMGLWAMIAAPLILSTDLTKLSPANFGIISNNNIIAIDQDALGVQGRVVLQDKAHIVVAKPLMGKKLAVLVVNISEKPITYAINLKDVQAPQLGWWKQYTIKDVFSNKLTDATTDNMSGKTQPHDIRMVILSPSINKRLIAELTFMLLGVILIIYIIARTKKRPVPKSWNFIVKKTASKILS